MSNNLKRIQIKSSGRTHNFRIGDKPFIAKTTADGVWARMKFGNHYGKSQFVYFFEFNHV